MRYTELTVKLSEGSDEKLNPEKSVDTLLEEAIALYDDKEVILHQRTMRGLADVNAGNLLTKTQMKENLSQQLLKS
jgi:predicted transcriptional regulator